MKKILLLLLLTFGLTVQAQEDHTGKVRLLDVSQGIKADSLLTYSSKKEIRYFKISDLLALVSNTLSFSNGQLTSLNGNTVDLDSYYYSQTEVDGLVSDASGALEFITEGGNTGIAIKGRDPLNYGDIGEGAVDLSFSNSASSTKGAVGDYSLSAGINNTVGANSFSAGNSNSLAGNALGGGTGNVIGAGSLGFGWYNEVGYYGFVQGFENYAPSYTEVTIGSYGTSYTPLGLFSYNASDRAFSVANGTDNANRNEALIVYKSGNAILDGELTADKFIKTGGTGNDILLADGTTTPLSGIGGGLDSKVDKVAGKDLSDENYTLVEKNKLSGIEASADVNRPISDSITSSSSTTSASSNSVKLVNDKAIINTSDISDLDTNKLDKTGNGSQLTGIPQFNTPNTYNKYAFFSDDSFSAPSSGKGLQLGMYGGHASFLAYDRDNSVYLPLVFDGETISFKTNGIEVFVVDDNGDFDFKNGTADFGDSITSPKTITDVLQLKPKTEPSSPTRGMIYYDDSLNVIRMYNGTIWRTISFL